MPLVLTVSCLTGIKAGPDNFLHPERMKTVWASSIASIRLDASV